MPDAGAVIFAAGKVETNGSTIYNFGAAYDTERESTGVYRVTFHTACPTDFTISATALSPKDVPRFCYAEQDGARSNLIFRVYVRGLQNNALVLLDSAFSFVGQHALRRGRISRFA